MKCPRCGSFRIEMKRADRVEVCTSEEAVRRFGEEQGGWKAMRVDCNNWFTYTCRKCGCCWSVEATTME